MNIIPIVFIDSHFVCDSNIFEIHLFIHACKPETVGSDILIRCLDFFLLFFLILLFRVLNFEDLDQFCLSFILKVHRQPHCLNEIPDDRSGSVEVAHVSFLSVSILHVAGGVKPIFSSFFPFELPVFVFVGDNMELHESTPLCLALLDPILHDDGLALALRALHLNYYIILKLSLRAYKRVLCPAREYIPQCFIKWQTLSHRWSISHIVFYLTNMFVRWITDIILHLFSHCEIYWLALYLCFLHNPQLIFNTHHIYAVGLRRGAIILAELMSLIFMEGSKCIWRHSQN